jgi:hypothetical protein
MLFYVPLMLNLWGTLYLEYTLYYISSYHDWTPAWVFKCVMFRTISRNKTGCHWNVNKYMDGINIILMCQVRNEALIQLMQLNKII